MNKLSNTEVVKKCAPYIIILILAFVFLQPFFTNVRNFGINDWDGYCSFDEISRVTLLQYGQFPLWNPYMNGGRPLLAHPHATFLRPTFLFSLLFGCVVGLKIETLFMLAFGMTGMFLLSRYYKQSEISGILMAAIFGLTGYFALHITEGHVDFAQLAFLPYVFLFFLKSLENYKYVLLGAVFLTLTILGAPPNHSLILIVLFLALFSLVHAIKTRSLKPTQCAALIICLTIGLGAIRLVPEAVYLKEHPRYVNTNGEMTSLTGLYRELADRNQVMRVHQFAEQKWEWHEYGSYVGILPLLLFLTGLLIFCRKEWPLIVSGLFFLILSLGDFAKYAPWNILHSIEPFSFMRVPSRFTILFIFTLAIIAGQTVNYLLNVTKFRKTAKCLLAVLALVIICDLILVSRLSIPTAFPQPTIEIQHRDNFLQMIDELHGTYNELYLNILSNNGTLNWIDPIDHQIYAKDINDSNYKGEVYLTNGGNATYLFWSPNKLIAEFKTDTNTTLVINQNFDSGWKAKGKTVENLEGLLAVNVTPDEKMAEFTYLPVSFILGSIISLIFILIVAFSYRYLRS